MREENLDGLVFKWRSIGLRLGVSDRTIRRWCLVAEIELPHWRNKKGEPVFLPEAQLGLLVKRLLRSPCRARVVAAARRKQLFYAELIVKT